NEVIAFIYQQIPDQDKEKLIVQTNKKDITPLQLAIERSAEGWGATLLSKVGDIFSCMMRMNKSDKDNKVVVFETLLATLPLDTLNKVDGTSGNTLLHAAAKEDNYFLFDLLIRLGVNTGVRNNDGETALDVATRLDQGRMVMRLLLEPIDSKDVCLALDLA